MFKTLVKTGGKFDIITGFVLIKESHQKEVDKYVLDHRPLVVVLGSPVYWVWTPVTP